MNATILTDRTGVAVARSSPVASILASAIRGVAAFIFLSALSGCGPSPPDPPAMSFSAHEGHRYMCPPCGVHDDLFFHEDGMCPVCGMALIERPDSSWIGRPNLHVGSGNFLMEGGSRRRPLSSRLLPLS